MANDSIADARDRMTKALDAMSREIASIRTGRASTRLVEDLKVDYFGQATALQQVAAIAAPDARLLTIQPWDRTVLGAIEKAIQVSDLGINPTNDGTTIRLAIPPLNEERRREMVKLIHKRAEEGRVAVRNVRRDVHDTLRKQEKAHDISEDDSRRLTEQLQKITDDVIHRIDSARKAKEAEVLEV